MSDLAHTQRLAIWAEHGQPKGYGGSDLMREDVQATIAEVERIAELLYKLHVAPKAPMEPAAHGVRHKPSGHWHYITRKQESAAKWLRDGLGNRRPWDLDDFEVVPLVLGGNVPANWTEKDARYVAECLLGQHGDGARTGSNEAGARFILDVLDGSGSTAAEAARCAPPRETRDVEGVLHFLTPQQMAEEIVRLDAIVRANTDERSAEPTRAGTERHTRNEPDPESGISPGSSIPVERGMV